MTSLEPEAEVHPNDIGTKILEPGSERGPLYSVQQSGIWIDSPSAGVCHVALRFSNGFTYSSDVTFTSSTQTGGCCPGTAVAPTEDTFAVDNPGSTCVDAGSADGHG